MITDAFDSVPDHLTGRVDEITGIVEDLRNGVIQFIQLNGQSGVGKTALANSVYKSVATAAPGRFTKLVIQSCWQESWSNVIANIAVGLAGARITRAANLDSLEETVLEIAVREDVLIVLDNIEQRHAVEVLAFLDRWHSQAHRSVIVVTAIEKLAAGEPTSVSYEIHGLANDAALELFGSTLRRRLGDQTLCEAAVDLRGIPLDILYVRWLDPATSDQLSETVTKIAVGSFDASLSLEAGLLEITKSPTHFMALGITRQLEFDEGLLAFLWDRLCSGTAEAYAQQRELLIRRQLLIPSGDPTSLRYRVSEQVHKHLLRALTRRIGGPNRLPIVHYYVSEYYRRMLDGPGPTVDALAAFVHHSLASGEHQRAFHYLFGSRDLVDSADADVATDVAALKQPFFEFAASAALQAQEVLSNFVGERATSTLTNQERLRVLTELAHLASDIGQFNKCIGLTEKIMAALVLLPYNEWSEVWRRIWYYRGVSYYNTGEPYQCAGSYFRIVESSPEGDRLGILSLGYLAHCLIMIDLTKAITYGRSAVMQARLVHDPRLLAKNLTSHAEALTYSSYSDESEALFDEAASICREQVSRSTDVRELGRTLGSWGALALCQGDLETAVTKVREGMVLSAAMGDRRRVAAARQYLAIALWRLDRRREAQSQLEKSILEIPHENTRYIVPPLLTLARWSDPSFSGRSRDLVWGTLSESVAIHAQPAQSQRNFDVYAAFWRDHYWPSLCIS